MSPASGSRLPAAPNDECGRVRDSVTQGVSLSGELAGHAAECAACSALVEDDAVLGRRLSALAPEQLELVEPRLAVRELIAGERTALGGLRSLATPLRLAIAALATAVIVFGMLSFAPRADLGVYPSGRMLVMVGLYAVLIGVALRHALRPLHVPMLDAQRRSMLLAALVAVPVALALAPEAHALHAASLGGRGSDFAQRALACFVSGVAMALPLLALLRLLDRSEHASRFGAALAACVAGAAGSFALDLHCALTFRWHLLAGHATVGVALVAAYLGLFGSRAGKC